MTWMPSALRRAAALCLVPIVAAAASGCRDIVRVHSHPPGAHLIVNGRPVGTIPEGGLAVDVKWWTFSEHHATLSWPNGATLHADFEKSIGEPNHPEYLVLDGILAIFFLVPGLIAFAVNGVGPEPAQHFHAPMAPPAKVESPAKPVSPPEKATPSPVREPEPTPVPES